MSTTTTTTDQSLVPTLRTVALVAVAALVGAGIATATSASAAGGWGGVRGCDSERHEAIEAALEGNEYDAWKALMGDKPIAQKVTEENFATLVALHEAREEGDIEKVRALREELGLYGGRGMHNRAHGWKYVSR